MMRWRVIAGALFQAIRDAEAGQWQTIDHQRQRRDMAEFKGFKRNVEVFTRECEFPKSASSNHSDKQAIPTYEIVLTVAKQAKGDVSTMKNEASTPEQKKVAIAELENAAAACNDSMDELIDLVWNVVMSAANRYINLEQGYFDLLYIDSFTKDTPHPEGNDMLLTAVMRVTCKTAEQVIGIQGVPAVAANTSLSINGDLENTAGVEVDPSA